jgi:predicted transcriptional regulator of viral defense system
VPPGVICLFSAWQFYGLTTFIPSAHHLTIPGKAKLVLPAYPPVKLYYWYGASYLLGKTEIMVEGQPICIYDLEKSVCDAIKFRNKVGSDIASEVLKNYLKRNDRNIDLLMKYARLLRVENILQQNLNVLL